MRGRVHRRGTGWAFVVDVGIDPVTGKRRQRTKGGFPTRKLAEAGMREVLNSVDEGSYVSRSTLKVGEYLRQWLETMRAQVRESTWYGYRIAVDRLVEQLGEVRLQSLTPLQVETAYAKLRKDGGRYGGPLAPKTVRNCHIVLHRALVDAVRLDLVNRNVAGIARPPSVPRHESVTWTAEELEAFLEHVSDDRSHARGAPRAQRRFHAARAQRRDECKETARDEETSNEWMFGVATGWRMHRYGEGQRWRLAHER